MANLIALVGGLVGFAMGGPAGAALGAGLGSAASGSSLDWVLKDAGLAYGAGANPFVARAANSGLASLPQGAQTFLNMDHSATIREGLGDATWGQNLAGGGGSPTIKKAVSEFKDVFNFGEDGFLGSGITSKDLLLSHLIQNDQAKATPLTDRQRRMLDTGEISDYEGSPVLHNSEIKPHRLQGLGTLQGKANGGYIEGPGTGKSDSIPAMIYQNGGPVQEAALSDGEFVMTADAVRGAGGGNRAQGAARMYQMMNQYEGVA